MNMNDCLSLIVSVVALFVSIYAITSQNKGVVFEHRLSIYTRVSQIYNQCRRILAICPGKKEQQQKCLIAMVLFGMQTDEYNISREYFQKYEKGEQPLNAQQVAVLDQYIEMYLKKYLNDSLCEESDIFFRKQIGSQVKKLYSAFDELMLGFLVLTEDELSHTYQKLKAILDEFQQNKILEKMKKKLPV